MNTRKRLAIVAAAFVASACVPAPPNSNPPWCDDFSVLILEAQSVPSAQLVPCLESLPLGWEVSFTWIDSEGTTVILDSELVGARAVEIKFRPACDTVGYEETQTDKDGVERFDLAGSVGEFHSRRAYLFDGGCTTLSVRFDTTTSRTLRGEVGRVLSFMPRSSIAEVVRNATDGRERLDPPAD